MIRRLNTTQRAELEKKNREFLAAHPGYHNTDYAPDYESDHSAEIAAAKQGKRAYQKMNY